MKDTSHIKISAEELEQIMIEQDQDKKRIGFQKIFDQIDLDHDGKASRDEIETFMWFMASNQGAEPTEESIAEAMQDNFDALDADHSGEIDFNEFFDALK